MHILMEQQLPLCRSHLTCIYISTAYTTHSASHLPPLSATDNMDSQITLIDPLPIEDSVYIFEHNDLKSGPIYLQNSGPSMPIYNLHTEIAKNSTTLRREDRSVVASLTLNTVLPDRIAFGNEASMRMNKWLRPAGKMGQVMPLAFESCGDTYLWTLNDDSELQLFISELREENAIATFKQAKHQTSGDESKMSPACLILRPQAEAMRDMAVTSLLAVYPRAQKVRGRARAMSSSCLFAAIDVEKEMQESRTACA